MSQPDAEDQYPPEEAQRRFEVLLRAVLSTPPLRMKDIPRKQPKTQRKVGKVARQPKRT